MPQVQNKQIDEITKRLKDEYDPEAIPRMQRALCQYHQEFMNTQKTYGDASISEIINAGRKDILFR